MEENLKTFVLDFGLMIRETVQEIAETMLFVEIEPGSVVTDQCDVSMDYCAIIDFGDGINGSFCLVATLRSAIKLASALLGEERLEMDEEMRDSFGEVANMIAGGLVTRVEGRFGGVSMTPPELLEGAEHPLAHEQEWFRLHYGFELDGVKFCAEVFLSNQFIEQKITA